MNPLLPESSFAVWHALIVAAAAVLVCLPVAAFFSVWRRHEWMDLTHVLIWIAIIVFAPFIGSIIWFAFGRQLHRDPLSSSHTVSRRS